MQVFMHNSKKFARNQSRCSIGIYAVARFPEQWRSRRHGSTDICQLALPDVASGTPLPEDKGYPPYSGSARPRSPLTWEMDHKRAVPAWVVARDEQRNNGTSAARLPGQGAARAPPIQNISAHRACCANALQWLRTNTDGAELRPPPHFERH